MSVRLGAETARDILVRSKLAPVALGLAALTTAAALHERSSDVHGADRALLGFASSLVVPLVCYAVSECAHGRAPSMTAIAALARHGADRHRLALGMQLVLVATSAVLTAALAVIAVLAASTARAGLAADLYACTWGGALIGAAYAGLFALGSSWGRRGRLWLFFGDWIFGSGSGFFALPWVRGHARNLLGGAPVLDTSQGVAAAALVALSTLFVLASASRGPS